MQAMAVIVASKYASHDGLCSNNMRATAAFLLAAPPPGVDDPVVSEPRRQTAKLDPVMPEVHNMHDAKTHLSRLAERAAGGEEIVIARGGRPLARLVALETPRKPRKLGLWKGEVSIGPDFDAPLPAETQRAFEGKGS